MDPVAAEVGQAEKSILEILPAGAAKRPDELIAAIEATAQGTLQRPSVADMEATADGTLRRLDTAE